MIHHFRVLPTDPRFKELTENQKVLLFHGWVHNANSDDLYRHQIRKDQEPGVTQEDEATFRSAGYSTEQINRIKSELRKAGYDA